MIRDTSAQDQTLSTPSTAAPWKRWLWPGIAALVVVLAIAFAARAWLGASRSFDSARVRIAEVKQGDLVRDLAADGKVVAGDVVKKGQELAIIDSPELRSKLAQERATLAGLEAEASRAVLDATLARAKASKETDQANIERQAAERDLQRYQRGFDGGAVPQIDLAKANDSLKKADISLANAQTDARLQGQGADLDARNKRLLADRQRAVVDEVQRQVDALTLRAPFDGQVGQVQATQHTNVIANAPILGVVDLSRFEIEIKVPESFARDLSIGIPAQLTSGNGQPFPGEISAVSPEVVAGEVNARIRFTDKQPQGLRQSQRMQSRVVLDTRRNVIKVERGPFVEQGNGQVYVMDGSTAIRRPVRLGVSSLGEVEILSGLRPGDRVVVSGAELFGDAETVSIN
jgi:HlyD family secretion protein